MCACVFLSSIKKNIAFLNINMIPTFLILVLRFCPDLFSKKKKKKKRGGKRRSSTPAIRIYCLYATKFKRAWMWSHPSHP